MSPRSLDANRTLTLRQETPRKTAVSHSSRRSTASLKPARMLITNLSRAFAIPSSSMCHPAQSSVS